jgi:excisionase family DNA binding protein
MLTTAQAAKYLGVHRSTVYRLVIEGTLPHLNTFKSWRIDRNDLDAFIDHEKVIL